MLKQLQIILTIANNSYVIQFEGYVDLPWHVFPINPLAQLHLNPLGSSSQVPPFLQGLQ